MPFIIKAVSLALHEFPTINCRVDLEDKEKPRLVMRPQHNVGVAMDTPQGLLVPNIKSVNNKSILEIAADLKRLQAAGLEGKLSPEDMSSGTITISNIGNVGGTYLSPVIMTSGVAIMGVGRVRTVPGFDGDDNVVKKSVVNFSWSADHRVVDGNTMARMAERVKLLVEDPGLMLVKTR